MTPLVLVSPLAVIMYKNEDVSLNLRKISFLHGCQPIGRHAFRPCHRYDGSSPCHPHHIIERLGNGGSRICGPNSAWNKTPVLAYRMQQLFHNAALLPGDGPMLSYGTFSALVRSHLPPPIAPIDHIQTPRQDVRSKIVESFAPVVPFT